ncbi:hypothetical protein N7448_006608 [Penicillium atrosanguineum]|uniref:T6SS Phospholipase effector Tle1-like catalytic domain-containing protein n=1 Tax=Penicillium atrosanguineum TaxID=1132637 RepID=A0A9W9U1V0_9EURO|nr:hypothetical protein N7448_006608 [Penicillium atrosanguineum]KAJ5137336.1 hypothetical protein N7526_003569 [Penicillium atrosanguineum]KAJ5307942.1 hypothetical protein N7476_008598 [Penicillium atrosanguineum]
MANPLLHHVPPNSNPKQFVLCFDGTGNKFAGDESDSNVLKIFRMLDRSKSHQYHYYQPGIGTYVTSKSLSSHGRIQRIKSWYQKAKDSAIGSSFDEHVMGGYKFLMRYYSPGDQIFFIGFSRGAYIARFLAEMLDYIGLLEAGNEELIRFAWKTFAKWQQRSGEAEDNQEEKKKLFEYMKAFRETFSRPISRIQFMGLFDTVNSVPRFENAWMQRSKFPYTARSSAHVIRHAVGIDERRAKFRQDLISGKRPHDKTHKRHRPHFTPHRLENHMARHTDAQHHLHLRHQDKVAAQAAQAAQANENPAVPSIQVNDNAQNGVADVGGLTEEEKTLEELSWGPAAGESLYRNHPREGSSHQGSDLGTEKQQRYRPPSPNRSNRSISLAVPNGGPAPGDDNLSVRSGQSGGGLSLQAPSNAGDDYGSDEEDQDIHEIWFPGCHADIGGGWKLDGGELWALSHAPLVWMVQEAQKAGLELDERKMKQFQCLEEYGGDYTPIQEEIAARRPSQICREAHSEKDDPNAYREGPDDKQRSAASRDFWHALHTSSTKGLLHDCLEFNQGLPATSVISWKIMEWLPFRRMDLQSDGQWKPIRWPLPRGEVRDVPLEAEIHVSAIRRMQADPKYRPGNVIVGGGGRGVRFAPEDKGMGDWVVLKHEGDSVRETYVRSEMAAKCKEEWVHQLAHHPHHQH